MTRRMMVMTLPMVTVMMVMKMLILVFLMGMSFPNDCLEHRTLLLSLLRFWRSAFASLEEKVSIFWPGPFSEAMWERWPFSFKRCQILNGEALAREVQYQVSNLTQPQNLVSRSFPILMMLLKGWKKNFQWFENWHKIQKSKLCAFYMKANL